MAQASSYPMKALPVAADQILLIDSEASNVIKKAVMVGISTWTPAFIGTAGNPTVSYNASFSYGIYYRIGGLVLVSAAIVVNSTSGGGGNLRVWQLPFAGSNGVAGVAWNGAIGFSGGWASNAPRAVRALAGQQYLELYDVNNNAVPVSALAAGVNFQFTLLYAA